MEHIGVQKVVTMGNLKHYHDAISREFVSRGKFDEMSKSVQEDMNTFIEETQEKTLKRLNKIDNALSKIDHSIESYTDISNMYTKNVMNELECIHTLLEVQHDINENIKLYLMKMNKLYRFCFFGLMFFILIILSIFGFYIF